MRHAITISAVCHLFLLGLLALSSANSHAAQSGGYKSLKSNSNNKNTNNKSNPPKDKNADDKEIQSEFIKDMPAEASIPELKTDDFDGAVSELKITKDEEEKLKHLRADIAEKRKALLETQKELRAKFTKASLADMEKLGPMVIDNRNECLSFKARQMFFNELVNILSVEQREILLKKKIPALGQS